MRLALLSNSIVPCSVLPNSSHCHPADAAAAVTSKPGYVAHPRRPTPFHLPVAAVCAGETHTRPQTGRGQARLRAAGWLGFLETRRQGSNEHPDGEADWIPARAANGPCFDKSAAEPEIKACHRRNHAPKGRTMMVEEEGCRSLLYQLPAPGSCGAGVHTPSRQLV